MDEPFARTNAFLETTIRVDANHDDICQIRESFLLSNKIDDFLASIKAYFGASAWIKFLERLVSCEGLFTKADSINQQRNAKLQCLG